MAQAGVIIGEKIRIPADAFEIQSFRRWAHSDRFPEQGRISFLAGEIDVDMSPEEIETHTKVKGDIYADLVIITKSVRAGEYTAPPAQGPIIRDT